MITKLKHFFFSIFFCLSSILQAQIPNRYLEDVFPNVVETTDVVFSTSVPQPLNNNLNFYSIITELPVAVKEYDTENVSLAMDIFEPAGDQLSERPLIIICFGGGFVQGSRKYWSMRLLAQGLARRGYVTALIDYRLGMNLFDQDLGARAVYRGIQDSRSAIRFFRANAAQYRIDTDKIFIGGHSSGGFIALHNLYMDKESERPLSTFQWSQNNPNDCPDQECLDCVGDNLAFNGAANGLFSLAAAVGDSVFLEQSSDAPPILFHSTDDGTVPYTTGEPFQDISSLILGSDLPIVYGSQPIALRCDDLSIPVQFNSYTNRGHGVHENGTIALHDDIIPDISSWFYHQYLKPGPVSLIGQERICVSESLQSYTINSTEFSFHDWSVVGGEIVSGTSSSPAIEVNWDVNAAQHAVSLLPYLTNGVQGDFLTIEVDLIDGGLNEWTGTNGSWDTASNWSTGFTPLTCEEVNIPDASIAIDLTPGKTYHIQSLFTGSEVTLSLGEGTQLKISQE